MELPKRARLGLQHRGEAFQCESKPKPSTYNWPPVGQAYAIKASEGAVEYNMDCIFYVILDIRATSKSAMPSSHCTSPGILALFRPKTSRLLRHPRLARRFVLISCSAKKKRSPPRGCSFSRRVAAWYSSLFITSKTCTERRLRCGAWASLRRMDQRMTDILSRTKSLRFLEGKATV